MRIIVTIGLLACLSGCAHIGPADGREASSLAGAPLMRPEVDPAKRPKLEQDLGDAKVVWVRDGTEGAAIGLGRAYAALGWYQDAIAAYTAGLERNPDSHRLRRHRGHRYITVRRLDDAARDFHDAWALAKGRPDAPESADGSSTDKSAILYHYGLAEYLRGEYARADDAFALRSGLKGIKDENVVSAAHWHYWALRRSGRNAEAARVIEPIREGMDVKENKSYYTLCRLYRGLVPLAEVERQMMGEDGKFNVGLAYGVACWRRFELKDEAGARALLERIVATESWPAFGHIAAEADIARWPR
ncbi:MAG TPA: hypothetical protein VEB22_14055 [Phycisphaerales bacterium]|nr:hypothetical protein [Phycisphaerales bacterium]